MKFTSLALPAAPLAFLAASIAIASVGCSITANDPAASAGAAATSAGTTNQSGAGGSATVDAGAGAGGTSPSAGRNSGGLAAAAGASAGGAGGSSVSAGGSSVSAGGSSVSAGGSVNTLPAGYQGTPFAALKIPGRINAADYDRGGAGVAWCHDAGNCGAGTVTGDYPGGSGVYRSPMPADAKICSGAACDDNVGVCRMNPNKPDNTINGQAMPATDTYLCYSVAGEWTKYTVVVEQAGMYSVGGIMAVPQNGAFNLSFGADITTGNVPLAITSTANSGSGENYHSWDTRTNLGTVTFPAAGTYLMTLTQVGRFNADAFTFTKL